jgi:ribosome maturation factor RimP
MALDAHVSGLAHIGIRVHDYERSRAFYERLGFAHAWGPYGPEQVAAVRHASGLELNFIINAPAATEPNVLMDVAEKHPGITHIALQVADLQAVETELAAAGVLLSGRRGTRAVFVRDPDGNVIELATDRLGADIAVGEGYIGPTSIVSTGWCSRAAAQKASRFFVGFGTVRGKTREDRNLLELLDPVAEAAGYEIVRLRLMGGGVSRHLQVMAEDSAGEMNVEACAKLSRAVIAVLDAALPIVGDYSLEVSSPGVDRPLTRLKDFAAFAGHDARIELDRLADGRKRFKGVLGGVDGDSVAIELDGEDATVQIPFAWISDAKLTLTDNLLKRGADKRAERLQLEQAPAGATPE